MLIERLWQRASSVKMKLERRIRYNKFVKRIEVRLNRMKETEENEGEQRYQDLSIV